MVLARVGAGPINPQRVTRAIICGLGPPLSLISHVRSEQGRAGAEMGGGGGSFCEQRSWGKEVGGISVPLLWMGGAGARWKRRRPPMVRGPAPSHLGPGGVGD